MTAKINQIASDVVKGSGDLVHSMIARDTPAFTAHRWLIGTRIGVSMIGLFFVLLYLSIPLIVPSALAI